MNLAYLVNLTPHAMSIYDIDGGDILVVLPPDGRVARVATQMSTQSHYIGGIPVRWQELDRNRVEGLPEQEGRDAFHPDTYYVVSLITGLMMASSGRTDLLTPGPEIRDDKGVIIGCKGLCFAGVDG